MPGRRRGRRGAASVTAATSLVDAASGGGTVVTVVVVADVPSGTSGRASGGLSWASRRRAYTFTIAYSTSAANTKTRQADIQTSNYFQTRTWQGLAPVHPDVDRFDVVDSGQRRVDASWLRRRCEDRQQADGNARRTRVDVDPERHPGQDHDEQARNVVLDQKVADVAAQKECDFQARKGT